MKNPVRYLRQADSRTRLLLALSTTMAGVLLVEASVLGRMPREQEEWIPTQAAIEGGVMVQAPQPPVMPPLAAYSEILSRPLFSDTRRPTEIAATATRAPALPDPSTKWKLTGVVSTGGESHAIVASLRDKSTQRLDIGTMLDGWKLVSIEPYRVSFESPSGSAVLELKEEATN